MLLRMELLRGKNKVWRRIIRNSDFIHTCLRVIVAIPQEALHNFLQKKGTAQTDLFYNKIN
jgi:hypothetical protein